jgi:pimeloyl-ACP methyl ester carboxylesterase
MLTSLVNLVADGAREWDMPTTANGDVSLYYESFGAEGDPVLLLVNGLGSQCINFKVELCEKFVDRGFRVVRFDNRDVGLSSHLKGGPKYTVDDMAEDGFAVLDAVDAGAAHIAGWSMGGMIVQAMALKHPERILSMTSVMSAPGLIPGERDPEVLAAFSAPAGTTREEAAERHLAGLRAWGSPACFEVDRITADAFAAFDRRWDPEGRARQAKAIASSPSREVALGSLRVPTLVVHGDADRLVPLERGRATAAAIPGARLEILEGMGHDYPPQYWDRLVELIATHATTSAATG